MKHLFRRGLLLAVLISGLVFHLAAQSTLMTIHMNDGTEHAYYMTESDRAYFEDNETLVVEIVVNAKSDRYNLADIQKITCHEVEGIAEDNAKNTVIFPNPVHEILLFQNLTGSKETIHIYALDGRMVMSVEAIENQPIDISDLSNGLYLVKTQSCTLKMIKL